MYEFAKMKLFHYLCDAGKTCAEVAQHRILDWLHKVIEYSLHLHGADIDEDRWKLDDFRSLMTNGSGIVISCVITSGFEVDDNQVVVVRVIRTRGLSVEVVHILTHDVIWGWWNGCMHTFTANTTDTTTCVVIPHLNFFSSSYVHWLWIVFKHEVCLNSYVMMKQVIVMSL